MYGFTDVPFARLLRALAKQAAYSVNVPSKQTPLSDLVLPATAAAAAGLGGPRAVNALLNAATVAGNREYRDAVRTLAAVVSRTYDPGDFTTRRALQYLKQHEPDFYEIVTTIPSKLKGHLLRDKLNYLRQRPWMVRGGGALLAGLGTYALQKFLSPKKAASVHALAGGINHALLKRAAKNQSSKSKSNGSIASELAQSVPSAVAGVGVGEIVSKRTPEWSKHVEKFINNRQYDYSISLMRNIARAGGADKSVLRDVNLLTDFVSTRPELLQAYDEISAKAEPIFRGSVKLVQRLGKLPSLVGLAAGLPSAMALYALLGAAKRTSS